MKYLGCMFSDTYSNSKHWDMKEASVASKIAMLENIGINKQSLSSQTKSFIFKCYIRPLIQYGVDTFVLNETDIGRIKMLEGNSLKDSLGLFRRIHSTELFSALDILPTTEQIKRSKLNLFYRLLDNQFTRDIVDNVLIESKVFLIENSLINDINDLVGTADMVNIKNSIDSYLNNQTIEFLKFKSTYLVNMIRNELNNVVINKKEIKNVLQAYETNVEAYRLMNIKIG